MDVKLNLETHDVDFSSFTSSSYFTDNMPETGYGLAYGYQYGLAAEATFDEHIIKRFSSLTTTTTSENLAQRLKIRLLTFQGEWFLDNTLGIDYFNAVFGKNKSKQSIDTIFQSEILKEKEVIQITKFESSLDRVNRKYSLSFEVRTVDGFYSVVNLTEFTL